MMTSPTGKVITVPLCHKLVLTTDGQNGVWNYVDVTLPEVEDWGPFLMGITAHTRCENMTTNVKWKVVFWWSVDGRNWSATPVDLFTEVAYSSSPVDAIKTEYNTVNTFGLKMKWGLAVQNASGTAFERTVVTVALAFKFLT